MFLHFHWLHGFAMTSIISFLLPLNMRGHSVRQQYKERKRIERSIYNYPWRFKESAFILIHWMKTISKLALQMWFLFSAKWRICRWTTVIWLTCWHSKKKGLTNRLNIRFIDIAAQHNRQSFLNFTPFHSNSIENRNRFNKFNSNSLANKGELFMLLSSHDAGTVNATHYSIEQHMNIDGWTNIFLCNIIIKTWNE